MQNNILSPVITVANYSLYCLKKKGDGYLEETKRKENLMSNIKVIAWDVLAMQEISKADFERIAGECEKYGFKGCYLQHAFKKDGQNKTGVAFFYSEERFLLVYKSEFVRKLTKRCDLRIDLQDLVTNKVIRFVVASLQEGPSIKEGNKQLDAIITSSSDVEKVSKIDLIVLTMDLSTGHALQRISNLNKAGFNSQLLSSEDKANTIFHKNLSCEHVLYYVSDLHSHLPKISDRHCFTTKITFLDTNGSSDGGTYKAASSVFQSVEKSLLINEKDAIETISFRKKRKYTVDHVLAPTDLPFKKRKFTKEKN